MEWLYKGKIFERPNDNDVGFVYEIEELSTGKKYIGKKLFWKTVRRKVKRGGKAIRRVQIESDWRKYYGSNKQLNENLEDPSNYKRTILHICSSKGWMSYYETKEQFDRGVLFSDDYYNEFIGCKINQKHLK